MPNGKPPAPWYSALTPVPCTIRQHRIDLGHHADRTTQGISPLPAIYGSAPVRRLRNRLARARRTRTDTVMGFIRHSRADWSARGRRQRCSPTATLGTKSIHASAWTMVITIYAAGTGSCRDVLHTPLERPDAS